MIPSPAALILTLTCPDRIGIVHGVSRVLLEHRCNIIESAQFTDPHDRRLFMRVLFLPEVQLDAAALRTSFEDVAMKFEATWIMHDPREKLRVLLLVSRFGHCLNDLLFRYRSGTLPVETPAIVSNHRDFEKLATDYGIPYHHLPVTAATKAQQEADLIGLIEDERIDLVVLARYMQVLSRGGAPSWRGNGRLALPAGG